MKNKIILACAAIAVLASCSKQAEQTAPLKAGEKAIINVTVNGGASTKASAETLGDEAKVGNLQVFVFNGDQLDVYGSVVSATSISLTATTGARTVYALVNAPDLSATVTLSSLKATISQLSHNAADGFVMAGSKDVTLAQSSNVTVPVDRLAARLRIKKITRKMTAAGLSALDAASFEVVRVYAAEVVTNNNYELSKTSGFTWKNSTLAGSAIDDSDAFLYKSAGFTLAQNASLSQDMCFYVYPNPTLTEGAAAMYTRLVIECKVDGNYYTYPVIIEGIESNKSYEINELVLTRLGNQSNGDNVIDSGEDDKIESFEIPFGITVNDWTLVLLGDAGTVTI